MRHLYWYLWMDAGGAMVVIAYPSFLRGWRLVAGGTIEAMHAAARLLTDYDRSPQAPTFDGTAPKENS